MGFLDRLFGTDSDEDYRRTTEQVRQASAARSEDEIAVERYRYLLRTAPPETIEQVHEEAFAKLTPEQRRMLFTQLQADAPAGDAPQADDAHSLAVAATRSEMRQPGTMVQALGGGTNSGTGAPGFGSMFASSLLGSVAGYVIASTLMSAFMPMDMGADATAGADSGADAGGDQSGGGQSGGDAGTDAGSGSDSSDGFTSADGAGDLGGGDIGGGDFGGGFGDGGFGDFGDFGF
ncbi:MAG: hypothetical protein EBR52_09135 [Microbacteriaceae bacterium]|nr:hypothetical protein [Microbacteriaceae bacterium]